MTIGLLSSNIRKILDAGEQAFLYVSPRVYNNHEQQFFVVQGAMNKDYPNKLKIIITEKIKGTKLTNRIDIKLSPFGHEL